MLKFLMSILHIFYFFLGGGDSFSPTMPVLGTTRLLISDKVATYTAFNVINIKKFPPIRPYIKNCAFINTVIRNFRIE